MTWAPVPTSPFSPRGRKATVKKKQMPDLWSCVREEVDDLGSRPY